MQRERLENLEKELTERENRLNERERSLDDRARQLEDRDRALFQREQRVAQREGTDMRLAEMRIRQLREMEAMIARHRDEMRTQM